MKKKIVSNWLHRLPVLCLALILAVMPLTMAVPSHAMVPMDNTDLLVGAEDVLIGGYIQEELSPVIGFEPGYYWVYFPRALLEDLVLGKYNYFFSVRPYQDEYIIEFFRTDSSVFPTMHNGGFSFPSVDSYESYYTIVPKSEFVPGEHRYQWMLGDEITTSFSGIALFLYMSETPWLEPGYQYGMAAGPALTKFRFNHGILSVFDGFGSWLVGAVQNISTMFWTAESGMTVLGYLAVASLALAVILLIFYLIAGWLKFH